MPNLSLSHLGALRSGTATQQQIATALQQVQEAINNIGLQTSSAPVGAIPAPTSPARLQVDNGGNYLSVRVTDPSPQYRAKSHFVEIADNPSFTGAHKVEMGASNALHYPVSGGTYHVRLCSSYATSPASGYVNHPPVEVSGSAALPLQPAQPVGTGGGGYGRSPFNTVKEPSR